jgi:inner membrane protein
MNAGGHIATAVAGVGMIQMYHPFIRYTSRDFMPLALALAAGVVGALAPDLDHPQSTLSHGLHIGQGDGPGYCVGALLRALAGGHRGATHSLAAVAAVVAAVVYLVPGPWQYLGWVFVIAYVSHLAGDLGGRGIPLFWPINHNRVRLWR